MNDEELYLTDSDPDELPDQEEEKPKTGGTGAFVDVKKGEELLHKFEIISLPVHIDRFKK